MWGKKLFIGVSGGCSKCSDSFYNLLLDVCSSATVKDVIESEEVWWLRKACQRSRCLIAQQVAEKFGVKIKTHKDIHSYDETSIGVPTVDTVEFDIMQKDDKVHLYNACVDTSTVQNGVLCHMNPTEGYWLFKGAPRSNSRGTSYGGMFNSSSGVFPTRAPQYSPTMGSASHIKCTDNQLVVRTQPKSKSNTVNQCFDETFMRNLEAMGWNRDHGVVELVPIIVGCQ
jgi:hypothetical protein